MITVDDRQRLVDTLRLPRLLVQASLDLERCPHNGLHDPEDAACRGCENRTECQWLFSIAESTALEHRPVAQLLQTLEYGLISVQAQVGLWGHDRTTCGCDACRWLRDSERLYDSVADRP